MLRKSLRMAVDANAQHLAPLPREILAGNLIHEYPACAFFTGVPAVILADEFALRCPCYTNALAHIMISSGHMARYAGRRPAAVFKTFALNFKDDPVF